MRDTDLAGTQVAGAGTTVLSAPAAPGAPGGWPRHGRTSRADAGNCQQHLDGQATAVMARGIAGLRSIDILRREVAGDEVEFTTILMFDDWAAVDALTGPDRAAAVIPAAARQWLRSYDQQSQHYDLVAHHADRAAGPPAGAALPGCR